MPEITNNTELEKTIPWKLVVAFILFTIGIIITGVLFYESQRNRIFSENQMDLSAIASLKISQIVQWHEERLGDAVILRDNEPLIRSIKQFFKNENDQETRRELTKWMESVNNEYDYNGISIVDTLMKTRLAFSTSDQIKTTGIRKELSDVMAGQKIIMTDLHRARDDKYVHIDILIPLIGPGKSDRKLFGILILRIAPGKTLFPLVQSWPTPSKSSETLLLRREGDSILYLNELRHQKNTAMNLRLPLSNQNLLASKAASGLEGVYDGIDYRNIQVVGSVAKIPGFPWYMVAKVDKEELKAPLKRYFFISLIVIILLILINASVFGFWIWNQQIRFYRSQIKNESTIRDSEKKFDTAFRLSPVSITISTMADNKFIDVNNTFLRDIEYTREEVIGRTAREIEIWANEDERLWVIDEIREKGEIYGKVLSFRSKTGKIIYGLASMSVVKVDGVPCNLSTVVNITESIKAETKIKQQYYTLNGIIESSRGAIFSLDTNYCYTGFNKIHSHIMKSLYGTDIELGKSILNYQTNEDDRLKAKANIDRALAGEYVEENSWSGEEANNRRFFEVTHNPIFNDQDEVVGVAVNARDLTERKLMEEKLRETNEYLFNLFNYANAPIIVWDTSLIITRFNPAFEQLSGYRKEEVIGKRIDILFNIEKKEDSLNLIKSAVRGERWEIVEIEIQRKEGDSKTVLWNSANILDNDGKTVIATIAQGHDITKRKKAEEELRESEIKFRQTFDLSPIGIVMVGLDKRFIRCNNSFSSSLGYKKEELIGKTIAEVTFPEDIKIGMNEMKAIAQGELEASYVQKRYIRKDGQVVWGDVRISLIRSNSGEPHYFLAIIQDISESRRVIEALRESEDKFKYVFDHSVIGISITSPSGEIHVNSAFCEMTGYAPEELETTKWQNISHPDDIEMTQKFVSQLVSGEISSAHFIKRYIHKDGSVIWADVGTALRRDSAGNPLYFMTAINNITDRKNAEEALRASELLTRLIIFNAPFGAHHYELEAGQRLVFKGANPAADVILGTDNQQFIGKTIEEAFPPLAQTEIPGRYRLAAATGERYDSEQVDYDSGNVRGAFEVHAFQTVPDHVTIFFVDITNRKKAEEQIRKLNEELELRVIQRTEELESSNKELEAFTYSVSHDLRAPLRSVHSFTQILLEEYENILDDEGKRICRIISLGATRMGGLIDDLLNFSRIGRSSLNCTLFNMKSMADSVFTDINGENKNERIHLKIEKLHKAYGDTNLIRQVWYNLISNAVKYSSKRELSEIFINSYRDGGMIVYSVKDNGVGFEMKYVHNLFGVFQRLHSENEFEGNGVGLAIVQRIVLMHKGKVWAEGEVGKGATFCFSLPAEGNGQRATGDRKTKNA